ncbi:Phenoxybenzoate dioxygenase subunit beta [Paraburkholderia humisilvae]|uniref:Phenoxybenzoate dioxygenase subunit beta n=2 Tax=Paraburkholderia humisilvae TaxID=627669 RepID=A0A6J5F780_9BURK|nr:Phenoxybenzoate dioxygenase subunit beta [Paraburkholderia humisilvae]
MRMNEPVLSQETGFSMDTPTMEHVLATDTSVYNTMRMQLISIHYASTNTNLYEIRRPDNATLPQASPGAHIDVHLPNGVVRQYSLVTADGDPRAYLIGIKRHRTSRGGSAFVHEKLHVGQMLDVGGPRNNFPLNEMARHTVLIAGGIGITPIWAMAQRLQKLGRSFELHYACRERREAAFIDQIEMLPQARTYVDHEQGGKRLDIPAIVARSPEDAHYYCCGPLSMLHAYETATAALDCTRVHLEFFKQRIEATHESSFTVELHRTGESFRIPAEKTILEVLEEAGIAAPHLCRKGICGACQVQVVAGAPDHRDSVLSEHDKKKGEAMLICCSRSKSERLVIDF